MRVEQGRPDGWRLRRSETQIVPEKKTGGYPRESGLIELSVQLLVDEKLRTSCTSGATKNEAIQETKKRRIGLN